MSTSIYNVRLRRARKSYAEAMADDPVLLYGEMMFVYDVEENQPCDKLKIGDGRKKFSELPWYSDVSKLDKSEKGKPRGVATLDENGKIPIEQIPRDLRIPIAVPQVSAMSYTGSRQGVTVNVEDTEGQVITGTLQATNAGKYYMAAKPNRGYMWEDGSTDTQIIEWEIQPQTIPYPVAAPVTYTGKSVSPTWINYDESKMTMTGELTASDVGAYVVTVTPRDNYAWEDGSQESIEIVWLIQK